ncbi:MAG: hypothetical protein HN352_11810 [Bacteroidetes bacterium]|jgi:hypothetical protein|nr:hypothetical protein [Bacteroidota bacterium]MBT3750168.1 hypothetical protein [Bacteroidota bacterium]MBT4399623.1 hypothetical protein [Bacteroidota bacterium]MBT7093921.1 hypothetical protein [Bacteroidota bacterium]MBT7462532.1 hypothetical protein [Bacteroidota bacterium]
MKFLKLPNLNLWSAISMNIFNSFKKFALSTSWISMMIIVAAPSYSQDNTELKNLSRLYTSGGFGVRVASAWHQPNPIPYMPKSEPNEVFRGLMEMNMSSRFHLVHNGIVDVNLSYAYLPTNFKSLQKNGKTIQDGPYTIDHLSLSTFMSYGLFKNSKRKFFVVDRLLEEWTFPDSTLRKYSGNWINFNVKSGILYGIGVLFLGNTFVIRDMGETDKIKAYKGVLGFRLEYYRQAIGAIMPIYQSVQFQTFFIDKSLGFDIGMTSHRFNELTFLENISGYRIGFRFYPSPWSSPEYLAQIYLSLDGSF